MQWAFESPAVIVLLAGLAGFCTVADELGIIEMADGSGNAEEFPVPVPGVPIFITSSATIPNTPKTPPRASSRTRPAPNRLFFVSSTLRISFCFLCLYRGGTPVGDGACCGGCRWPARRRYRHPPGPGLPVLPGCPCSRRGRESTRPGKYSAHGRKLPEIRRC